MPELEACAASGGGSVLAVAGSIKVEEDARNIITTTLERFGRLDHLVNNGGGQFEQAAADMNLKGWSKSCSRAALALLLRVASLNGTSVCSQRR